MMNALGRLYNMTTSATTAGQPTKLTHAGGMSIVLIGATSGAATVQQLTAASGGTANDFAPVNGADGITEYWRWSAGTWTKVTQAAGATFTAGTGGLAVVDIGAEALAAGYKYLSASHASGSFVYVQYDLKVGRKVTNLASNIS